MVKTRLGYVYNQNALGIRIILDDAAHLLGGINMFLVETPASRTRGSFLVRIANRTCFWD